MSKASSKALSKALIVLRPSESKRLIAKAVAAKPEVRRALTDGLLVIIRGTSTSYVADEILGRPWPREGFVAGWVGPIGLSRTPKDSRKPSLVLERGRQVDLSVKEALDRFGADDVFIKGGNAVDSARVVGAMLGGDWGGTTGMAMGALASRGSNLIIPIGLEKLVPSVTGIVGLMGNKVFEFVTGDPVGMMPIAGADVVTEIEAMQHLAAVEAHHVAGGGVGGAEGSVTLVVEGDRAEVQKVFELAQSIKGEPPFPAPSAS